MGHIGQTGTARSRTEQIPSGQIMPEAGTLEEVARLAANWFQRHLVADMAA